jgi:DNA-binding NarL/FixJ family response regulator
VATTDLVVIAENFAFAELLGEVVEREDDLHCVAVGRTATEAIARADDAEPSVVIVASARAEEQLRVVLGRWPASHVVVVADLADPTRSVDLACAGAAAVLPNDCGVVDVMQTVRSVGAGVVVMTSNMIAAVRNRLLGPKADSRLGRLKITPRERDVLTLVGQAMAPGAIADSLGISIHTCRGHLKSLMMKLGLHSQLELAVFAAEHLPGDSAPHRHAS